MPRSAKLLAVALGVLGTITIARVARSQARVASYAAIDGTIVDSTGRGLAGVDVIVMDTRQTVRTKSTGAYRIDSVAPGPHILRFRRIGLQPVTVTIDAAANDVIGADVVMPPFVHQLATVEVQGQNGDLYYMPKEFVDQMKNGQGVYLTEAQIENRHALVTADLFRNIPGVTVGRDSRSLLLKSARGPTTLITSGCYTLPVYVNSSYAGSGSPDAGAGTDAHEGGESAPAPGSRFGLSTPGTTGLDAVDPTNIVGIEIYRGPSEMPSTLPPSPCGAVVIWTK